MMRKYVEGSGKKLLKNNPLLKKEIQVDKKLRENKVTICFKI